MIVCPVCRAENGQPNCRRCKADLSMLFALKQEFEAHLAAAASAIQNGQPAPALVHLDAAEKVRFDSRIPRLRALAELLQGRFGVAYGIYREAVR